MDLSSVRYGQCAYDLCSVANEMCSVACVLFVMTSVLLSMTSVLFKTMTMTFIVFCCLWSAITCVLLFEDDRVLGGES